MENVDRKIFDELFYFKQEVEKELKELRGIMGELIQVINSLKENSNKEILMMKDLLEKFTDENNFLKHELTKKQKIGSLKNKDAQSKGWVFFCLLHQHGTGSITGKNSSTRYIVEQTMREKYWRKAG